jgi:Protein of unknown function DUF262/Protein of unknown function (DUF1524)
MSVENGQRELGSLFADSVLRVPQFQRAYAWERDPHLRNFVDDLSSHPAEAGQKYFFGTILLTRAKTMDASTFTGYDVVDGQQRLTTACIFIATGILRLYETPEFKDVADDYSERFIQQRTIRKLRTIQEDDVFFERFIVGKETGNDANCATPSQRRLLEAKKYFTTRLADVSASSIDQLIQTLWRSQILIYAVNSNAEATQIFELQNDRGKRLTELEALKSFLMHGLYLHAGDNKEIDLNYVQSQFASIYRTLEQLEGRFAAPSEDQLLSYHCIAYEKWVSLDGVDGWEKPKQLVQHLLQGVGGNEKAAWIKGFSNRLRDSYDFCRQILDARDTDVSVSLGELAAMNRTATFWPLLLKCWKLDKSSDKGRYSDAVAEMASFTFRASISSKRADTGEPTLRQRARDFDGNFPSLMTYLAELCKGWDIPNSFAHGLETENFYDWQRLGTYMLWRYENYLRTQPGRQSPHLSWKTIVAPTNAAVRYAKDHIEPKDPKNPNLLRQVKWNPKDENTRPFSEGFLNRLGNLVLDTTSTGSAKGNGDFQSRISHYTESTFLSQSEIVSRFASKKPDGTLIWDEAAIRRRHDALVEFANTHM